MDGGDLLVVELLTFFDELSIAQEQCVFFFGGEFLHQQGKRKEYYFTDAQFILFIKKSSIKTREILVVFEEMLPLFHSLFIVWGGHFGIFRRKNWTNVFKVVFNEC